MDHDSQGTPPKRQQTLGQRLFWFFAGAGVNYLLISTPYKILESNYAGKLHPFVLAGSSMAVSTTFFFFWNYFVNFRTDSRKRDALARYITAVVVLWAISSSILALFKSFKTPHIGSFPLDLDVIATQACFGWLKFIVYHKWAFPVAKADLAAETAAETAAVPPDGPDRRG